MKKMIDKYTSIFYLEDTSIIPVLFAAVLSCRMYGKPIWLMLVGGSSSGKSELISAFSKIAYVKPISMLTSNTLLSGMKGKKGTETSLLLKIDRKSVFAFNDFTTILSMNKEDQVAVMGQFREIYDGETHKDTGTGETLDWKGKISIIGGVTDKIHVIDEKFNEMGSRFIYYTMPEQDRIKTTRRSVKIAPKINQYRDEIQDMFKEYADSMISKVENKEYESLGEESEMSENLIQIADLASLARSPIERKQYQGNRMGYQFSHEMPMRISNQIHAIAGIFKIMFNGDIPPMCEKALYKIAVDSIPKGRRMVLDALAKYDTSTTKRIATEIHYSTEQTRDWLEELDALRIVERGGATGRDTWTILPQYSVILNRVMGIERVVEEDPFAEDAAEYEAQIGDIQDNEEVWDSLVKEEGIDPEV